VTLNILRLISFQKLQFTWLNQRLPTLDDSFASLDHSIAQALGVILSVGAILGEIFSIGTPAKWNLKAQIRLGNVDNAQIYEICQRELLLYVELGVDRRAREEEEIRVEEQRQAEELRRQQQLQVEQEEARQREAEAKRQAEEEARLALEEAARRNREAEARDEEGAGKKKLKTDDGFHELEEKFNNLMEELNGPGKARIEEAEEKKLEEEGGEAREKERPAEEDIQIDDLIHQIDDLVQGLNESEAAEREEHKKLKLQRKKEQQEALNRHFMLCYEKERKEEKLAREAAERKQMEAEEIAAKRERERLEWFSKMEENYERGRTRNARALMEKSLLTPVEGEKDREKGKEIEREPEIYNPFPGAEVCQINAALEELRMGKPLTVDNIVAVEMAKTLYAQEIKEKKIAAKKAKSDVEKIDEEGIGENSLGDFSMNPLPSWENVRSFFATLSNLYPSTKGFNPSNKG
jgi:hypothetical protein